MSGCEGCAGGEMVTVVDVYTRGADGGIEHYQLIPQEAVGSCAGCAAVLTAPVSATAADAGRAAMRTELMACPWCRSTCLNEDFDEEGWYVECNGCLARGPVADTPEEAEAAWNRRA